MCCKWCKIDFKLGSFTSLNDFVCWTNDEIHLYKNLVPRLVLGLGDRIAKCTQKYQSSKCKLEKGEIRKNCSSSRVGIPAFGGAMKSEKRRDMKIPTYVYAWTCAHYRFVVY